MSFTNEELERMSVVQLKNIARYLGVGLEYRMKKGDIIEKILNTQEVPQSSVVEVEEVNESVRVKRLKELNK